MQLLGHWLYQGFSVACKRIASTLRSIFRKEDLDRELDDELRSYLDLVANEEIRAGMSRDEAYRQARIELGGLEQVKENVRDRRLGAYVDVLLQDLRVARRSDRGGHPEPGSECSVRQCGVDGVRSRRRLSRIPYYHHVARAVCGSRPDAYRDRPVRRARISRGDAQKGVRNPTRGRSNRQHGIRDGPGPWPVARRDRGLLAGLAVAYPGTLLIRQLLFETTAVDPLSYAGAVGFLVLVALRACLIWARRATRTEIMEVLRTE